MSLARRKTPIRHQPNSNKNAADDKLITLAYTFKGLSNDQRQAIYIALKDEPAGVSPSALQIGTVLPFAVPTRAIPAQLTNNIPAAQGYYFLVSDSRVLLISPATRIVVGVFTSTADATPEVGGTVQ